MRMARAISCSSEDLVREYCAVRLYMREKEGTIDNIARNACAVIIEGLKIDSDISALLPGNGSELHDVVEIWENRKQWHLWLKKAKDRRACLEMLPGIGVISSELLMERLKL